MLQAARPCALLVMVAAGGGLFIVNGLKERQFAYLNDAQIELEYGAAGIVREKMDAFKDKHAVCTVTGVVMAF